MECDLCGKYISSNDEFEYDISRDSNLCLECFGTVSIKEKDEANTATAYPKSENRSVAIQAAPPEIKTVVLIIKCVILALLVAGPIFQPALLLLPLGIPILFKEVTTPRISFNLLSYISYGSVIGLLILILTTQKKRRFIIYLAVLFFVLLLNFAGCKSGFHGNRFIDG